MDHSTCTFGVSSVYCVFTTANKYMKYKCINWTPNTIYYWCRFITYLCSPSCGFADTTALSRKMRCLLWSHNNRLKRNPKCGKGEGESRHETRIPGNIVNTTRRVCRSSNNIIIIIILYVYCKNKSPYWVHKINGRNTWKIWYKLLFYLFYNPAKDRTGVTHSFCWCSRGFLFVFLWFICTWLLYLGVKRQKPCKAIQISNSIENRIGPTSCFDRCWKLPHNLKMITCNLYNSGILHNAHWF